LANEITAIGGSTTPVDYDPGREYDQMPTARLLGLAITGLSGTPGTGW